MATGVGVASVGIDRTGSVRTPAARCSQVALKPTRGRIAHPPAIRSPGAIVRTVDDVVTLHNIVAQRHNDNTRLPRETRNWAGGRTDVDHRGRHRRYERATLVRCRILYRHQSSPLWTTWGTSTSLLQNSIEIQAPEKTSPTPSHRSCRPCGWKPMNPLIS
ncbi:hypothetical protein ERC79_06045 [Rhodococcus sp. ABRD24]|nr:hypothetical protein ERC79_06045 [Rhodococcus sp. ABRD24]